MKIRKYSKNDLLLLKVQPQQKIELNFTAAMPETCFTVEDGDEIIGVFGVVEMYKGRGNVFAFISQNSGKKMVSLVRLLKKIISKGMERAGYERLEMSVLQGFNAADRLAVMLGFEYEGLMRNYFKGKNYKLYAKIREEK